MGGARCSISMALAAKSTKSPAPKVPPPGAPLAIMRTDDKKESSELGTGRSAAAATDALDEGPADDIVQRKREKEKEDVRFFVGGPRQDCHT